MEHRGSPAVAGYGDSGAARSRRGFLAIPMAEIPTLYAINI
jgi:hypothetical protein